MKRKKSKLFMSDPLSDGSLSGGRKISKKKWTQICQRINKKMEESVFAYPRPGRHGFTGQKMV